jgi:eukaryotic-like serine/threonine-protein kinase
MQFGSRVSHYEIVSAIGRGGMGEVWKALDTKLRRHVAIKTVPEEFAREPERLARLEREAELLAALNHPNIAAIHGLEEHDGRRFLVLELVEGATLDERILRGQVPVGEALKLALQIAEALEAAHEKGVIHRDLKPANIKVTLEGRVKVLDFGLAKALGPAPDDALTQTAGPTREGVILGTPAYMSPEQARGEAAGRQTDIWAFGAVLYELLTRRSPFRRKTPADTLASVIAEQPDYTAFPSETPVNVRRLVHRCLEKDQKHRLQHIGDVRIELEDALAALGTQTDQAPTRAATMSRSWRWAAGAIAIAGLAWLSGWFSAQRSVSTAATVRLSIPFLERPVAAPYGVTHLAISDDGSRIAYASSGRLWIRRLDQKDPVAIGAQGTNPFFSPDGAWVGLFRDTSLVRVPVDGGTPISIAMKSERAGGGTWRADGTIVFATTEGLYQVSQEGGNPRLLAAPDRSRKERLYAWPHFLPDGQSLLFTILQEGSADEAQIAILDLKSLDRRILLTGGSSARYLRTGHLLYASGQALKAIPFDAATGQVRGDALTFSDVEVASAADNGAADFAISSSGTLIFAAPVNPNLRELRWIDRQGNEEPLAVEPRLYAYPRISPDGTRVALDISGPNRDIWILNLERLSMVQLTDGPTEDMLPEWSPDSQRVFFSSDRTGNFDVYSQEADGASGARVEFAAPGFQSPQSVTPDGSRLIVYDLFKDTAVLELGKSDRLEPLLHSDSDERLAQISPDGKWIVYESDESGEQFEIFVRPFPNVSEKREKISIDGGRFPLWGPSSSGELYYVNLEGEVMAASITLTPGFKLGKVTKLFTWQRPPGRSGRGHDVSPVDGRFLVTRAIASDASGQTFISVILNWTDELRKRAESQP